MRYGSIGSERPLCYSPAKHPVVRTRWTEFFRLFLTTAMRSWLHSVFALLGAALLTAACSQSTPPGVDWPDWERFVKRYMPDDAHVVDVSFDRKTVSEGQSYAMFFALVANQRSRFDALLNWTSQTLAQGHLGDKLPDWYWGPLPGGGWGIKDPTSATDADLLIVYDLLEAARLWNAPGYAITARRMMALIARTDVVDSGIAGLVLLPGEAGFNDSDKRFFIDPSYLPGFVMARMADTDPAGPWQRIWDGLVLMLQRYCKMGVAPNLFVVDRQGDLSADTDRPAVGSYDAIRVYLWAGMSGRNSEDLVRQFAPFAALVSRLGSPPEQTDPLTGAALGPFSPTGFSGAVLPFLAAAGDRKTLDRQISRLRWARLRAMLGGQTAYYDDALILFGKGWQEKRYRFDDQGRLHPRWEGTGGIPLPRS